MVRLISYLISDYQYLISDHDIDEIFSEVENKKYLLFKIIEKIKLKFVKMLIVLLKQLFDNLG